MSRFVVSNENIIEPTVENLQKLLSDGKYIICGHLHEKGNPESFILENVLGKWGNKLFGFCVSNYDGSTRFRLHLGSFILENELETIVGIYDMFVVNSDNVNRGCIYGELGSRYEKEIILYRILCRGDF